MKIKTILWQTRRDFKAIFECEHCGDTRESIGYDDTFFHNTVIPEMLCNKCGKNAPKSYKPLSTKYPDSEVV